MQLDLAIQGDVNLKYNGYHDSEIDIYEKDILKEHDRIAKIELVMEGEVEEDANEVLFDEEAEY